MNKIFKYLLGVLGILFIGVNLCNAWFVASWEVFTSNITNNYQLFDFWSWTCLYGSNATAIAYSFDWVNNAWSFTRYKMYCLTWTIYLRSASTQQARTVALDLIKETCPTCPTIDSNYCTSNNLCPSCPTCETCEEQYTSLECQTEYNLIPVSSVTQSYCELNYNLIDPSTCPISEWTWVVNWSSLFINNTQYAWNDNIEIFIPDFIWWSIIYNSWSNYIDIEWYNADTEYIENVINQEKMTPTADDFAMLIQWTANFIPYLFIWLLIIFMVKILSKIWK